MDSPYLPGISGEEATILIRKFNQQIPNYCASPISLDD